MHARSLDGPSSPSSRAAQHTASNIGGSVSSRRIANNWLSLLLFVTILGSPFVSIEPSPYEALVLVLAVGLVGVGLPINVRHLPLIMLAYLLAVGGLLAVMPVLYNFDAMLYYMVTVYLAISTLLFASLFSSDVMHRLGVLRAAYILAATLAAFVGTLGYFGLIPGAEAMLENGRVRATFKDPNVFGPFLILPLLLILMQVLRGKLRVGYIVAGVIILLGLFLSFSRGAWAHFVLSASLMVILLFLTERSAKRRANLFVGSVVCAIAVALIVSASLSTKVVANMFAERARLEQYYDVGHEGRFARQLEGLREILQNPNGVGPHQFGKKQGADPHNVYINAFLSYGWIGGFAYVVLVLGTLHQGLWALWRRTPWQPFLIAIYSTFVGVVAEGFIVDTDHWRHFFLLMGLIWGLGIATAKHQQADGGHLQPQ
jgi:O-antigen ligase